MHNRVADIASVLIVLGLPALIIATTVFGAISVLMPLYEINKFITLSDISFGLTLGLGSPAWYLDQAFPDVARFFSVDINNFGQRAWLGVGVWVVFAFAWFKIGGVVFSAAQAIDRSVSAKR